MGAYARVFALAGISQRRREISVPDSDQFALAAQAIVTIINLCRFPLYLSIACRKGCDSGDFGPSQY